MFNNIKDAVAYIESKRNKRTVDQFRDTLRSLEINMKQHNMIHVAGTNGKGSTVNYLRAILNANGYRVGTFTSPYLKKHNDRICIDNEPISDEDLLKYINKYYDVIEKEDMSMFEIDTMICLAYFQDQELDYRIIECGIGGEHDKTNVIDPIISVITNIGLDHMDTIGPSLYDIINEKMGIIKPGQLFITSEISGTVLARLQEQCDAMDARMIVVPEYEISGYPFYFVYRDMEFTLKNQAAYQVTNARLALTIVNQLIRVNPEATVSAVENTIWAGRFETIERDGHTFIIDGAHNMPAIDALMKTLKFYKDKKACIVYATLRQEQATLMVSKLEELGLPLIMTSFEDERIVDLSQLETDENVSYIDDFKVALESAQENYEIVFVTGSLHFISQVRAFLKEN